MKRKTQMTLLAILLLVLTGSAAAKMTLVVWDWHEPRHTLLKEYIDLYTSEHPDITFELELTGNYWEKLSIAIAAGTPPDIAKFHNERTDQFVEQGFLSPFPEKLFPHATMRRNYVMFDGFLLNGQLYYHPAGIMTPAVYYNVDLLNRAGYDKPPQQWGEFITAAQKMTVKDPDGSLEQTGFSWVDDMIYFFTDLVYQNGGYLLRDGGVDFGSQAGKTAIATLESLLEAGVSNRPGVQAQGALESGQVAMKYQWTWYTGVIRHHTDLNWSATRMPTYDGSLLPAIARNNYESGYSVPAGLPPEREEEAFKFIKWLYDQLDYHVKLNLLLGRIPGLQRVWNHPDWRGNPVFQMQAQTVTHTVYPGPLPSWFWPVLTDMKDRILEGTTAPQIALEMAVHEGDAKWQELPPKFIVERQYQPPR